LELIRRNQKLSSSNEVAQTPVTEKQAIVIELVTLSNVLEDLLKALDEVQAEIKYVGRKRSTLVKRLAELENIDQPRMTA